MIINIYIYINIIVSTTTQPNPTRFWDLFRGTGKYTQWKVLPVKLRRGERRPFSWNQ